MVQNGPSAYVSQPDKDPDESDWYYDEPNFVLVLGEQTHLWADGNHYMSDPDGEIEPGQLYLMRDPGFGVFISEITDVDISEETATVRHFLHWQEGEVEHIDDVEIANWGTITGDYDRAMGDTSTTEFVREV